MTVALVAGIGAVVFAYLVLDQIEIVRHGRWMRRALVAPPSAEGRRGLRTIGTFWDRIGSGELPLRTIQTAAVATLVMFAAGLALRSLTISSAAALVAILTGYAWTQRRRWTLAARVERPLPEAMIVMANALSAGGTVFQALESAAQETPPPLGFLLQRAVSRAHLGATVEEALIELRDEVGSRDVSNLVVALAIQRATGGDLARLLRESAEFLKEEQRLRADARALSAQARYSAQMIGVMPIALFALFYAFFPSFIEPLTSTTLGLLILAYSFASSMLGFYAIWRIATGIERI